MVITVYFEIHIIPVLETYIWGDFFWGFLCRNFHLFDLAALTWKLALLAKRGASGDYPL